MDRETGMGDGELNTILYWSLVTWLPHSSILPMQQLVDFSKPPDSSELVIVMYYNSISSEILTAARITSVTSDETLAVPSDTAISFSSRMLEYATEVPGSLGENIRGGLKVLWFMVEVVQKIYES